MTIQISKREISRDIYKYLKEGEYVVTNHGVPEYVVTIKKVSGEIPVVTNNVVTKIDTVEEVRKVVKFVGEKHSCGCKREGKNKTCPKHYCY